MTFILGGKDFQLLFVHSGTHFVKTRDVTMATSFYSCVDQNVEFHLLNSLFYKFSLVSLLFWSILVFFHRSENHKNSSRRIQNGVPKLKLRQLRKLPR